MNTSYRSNLQSTSLAHLTGKADDNSNYTEPVKENETRSVLTGTNQNNHLAVSSKKSDYDREREQSETAEKQIREIYSSNKQMKIVQVTPNMNLNITKILKYLKTWLVS